MQSILFVVIYLLKHLSMIQDAYDKFAQGKRRNVTLKKFEVTATEFSIDILCDGKSYKMEYEQGPGKCGECILEGWPDEVSLPKDALNFGYVIYHDEFILLELDSVLYCFASQDYKPLEIKSAYLYDIIFVENKIYILVGRNNPQVYETKVIVERPSQLFFVDAEGKWMHGYISASEDFGFLRGTNIVDDEGGLKLGFVIEPLNETVNILKKEACN